MPHVLYDFMEGTHPKSREVRFPKGTQARTLKMGAVIFYGSGHYPNDGSGHYLRQWQRPLP